MGKEETQVQKSQDRVGFVHAGGDAPDTVITQTPVCLLCTAQGKSSHPWSFLRGKLQLIFSLCQYPHSDQKKALPIPSLTCMGKALPFYWVLDMLYNVHTIYIYSWLHLLFTCHSGLARLPTLVQGVCGICVFGVVKGIWYMCTQRIVYVVYGVCPQCVVCITGVWYVYLVCDMYTYCVVCIPGVQYVYLVCGNVYLVCGMYTWCMVCVPGVDVCT